jgi:hypothetical protein
MDLEERLRRTLRPVDPGDAFAERVLARLDAARASHGPVSQPRGPLAPVALAASVVLALAVGAALWRDREVRHERAAQEAGLQLARALDITSRRLEQVHRWLDQDTRKETGS